MRKTYYRGPLPPEPKWFEKSALEPRYEAPQERPFRSSLLDELAAMHERSARGWSRGVRSAEHGLVPPERTLAPYERTLNTMHMPERQVWATLVKAQMEKSLPAADRIVVLAGIRYREFLMDYLRQRAGTVEVPMEGLGIGRQLHYLMEALRHERV
jgi:uncharacterized protein DUF6884